MWVAVTVVDAGGVARSVRLGPAALRRLARLVGGAVSTWSRERLEAEFVELADVLLGCDRASNRTLVAPGGLGGQLRGDPRRGEAVGVDDRLMTVPEVAAELHVSDRTVRRMISDGRLAAVRVGRVHRIRHQDLAAYMRAHATGAA